MELCIKCGAVIELSNCSYQDCPNSDTYQLPALLPCPFCGETPELPSPGGTQYEMWCDCGMAIASVQIPDLMTLEERLADPFTNNQYREEYIYRAKVAVTAMWNDRTTLTDPGKEL